MMGIMTLRATDRFDWTEQYRGTRLEAICICPSCNTPMVRLTGWKPGQFHAIRDDLAPMSIEGLAFNQAVQEAAILSSIGAGATSGNLLDQWACDDGPANCKTQSREGAKVHVLNISELPKV